MNPKKLALWLSLLFVLFWVYRDPVGLADRLEAGVTSVWGMVQLLFTGLIRFADTL
ncbi:MAG: hypothetical protein ACRCYQ_09940 [Nocardioides sp.]